MFGKRGIGTRRSMHLDHGDATSRRSKPQKFDKYPLQLNFAKYMNDPTLSDIKIMPLLSFANETNSSYANNTNNNANNGNKEASPMNTSMSSMSNMSSMGLDEEYDICQYDGNSSSSNGTDSGNNSELLFHCHWDILRARCIMFDLMFHALCSDNLNQINDNNDINDKFYLMLPEKRKDEINNNNSNGSGLYGVTSLSSVSKINKISKQFPIICINTSYEALKLVINYLYSGMIRNRVFDDNIHLAKQTLELCDLLHLPKLKYHLSGTFLHSRKQMRELFSSQNSINNESNQNNNQNNLSFATFESFFPYKSYAEWIDGNKKDYFFNIKVLYNKKVVLHDPTKLPKNKSKNTKGSCKQVSGFDDCRLHSRQWIKFENGDIYCISKFIFYCVSQYFQAMFDHNWMENQEPSVLCLKEVTSHQFETIIHFFYTFETRLFYLEESEWTLDKFYDRNNNSIDGKEEESKLSEKDIGFDDSLDQLFDYLNICDFFMFDDLRQCILSTIDHFYIADENLYKIWKFGIDCVNLQLSNQISNICQTYFQENFEQIVNNKEIFYKLEKKMIKEALSNGKIGLNTNSMIQVLLEWVEYHNNKIKKENSTKSAKNQTKLIDLCELLPPNTLFNRANKHYLLLNRQPMNLRHFLSLH